MGVKISALPLITLAKVAATTTLCEISDLGEALPANQSKQMSMQRLASWLATSTIAANTCQIGQADADVQNLVIGLGDTVVSPAARKVRFTNASGADNAAGNVTWTAPRSTGAGVGAAHVFQVGQPGVSSAVLQTLATVLTLDATSTLLRANFGTAITQFGAAPGSTAAVNVDASSYGTVILSGVNGTATTTWNNLTNGLRFGTTSANHSIFIETGNTDRWQVTSVAGTSELISSQATARIIGGATNGISLRNSASTRDNFTVNDAGSTTAGTDGTRAWSLISSTGSGEGTIGYWLGGHTATSGVAIATNDTGTAGVKGQFLYYNQTQWYSALEIANIASGFGTLALMKSGGDCVFGLTTAGATNATQGFLYITTCAGAPTGVPGNAAAGSTAMRYDSTNHKLWVYDQPAGAWKGIVVL